MKAFTFAGYGSGLAPDELPLPPSPGAGHAQLRLLGTSINPVDQLIANGYGAPLLNPRQRFPLLPGRDAVAQVEAVGRGVHHVKPGQRVLVAASPRTGGTYAELFNLPARCMAPVEDRLSVAVAAGIGYAGLTALQALAAAGLTEHTAHGKKLCINGASGGVGSVALLLASHWGAQITAVASRKNHVRLQTLAPCRVVDYHDSAAMAEIRADIVLNCATPATDDRSDDPLLPAVRQSRASHRAYVTTVSPLLHDVTEKGVVKGLARSGLTLTQKRLVLGRAGIRYRWVMFREDSEMLAYLAAFFTRLGTSDVVGDRLGLDDLPRHFNGAAASSIGKAVFLTDRA